MVNPGALGSSHTESSGFFVGVSLGKTLQSPVLVLVKPRKDMNNVCCRRDMTEIYTLESDVKHHSINQSTYTIVKVKVIRLSLNHGHNPSDAH